MGASAGIALKFLQWFIRGVQFCCSAIVLGIFSYFLATLNNHGLHIKTWIRAVTGISGIGVIYTFLGLLLLCCLAGHPFTSFIAIVLDVCFIGAFIYVAVENRAGAGSCRGHVNTAFGSGDSATKVHDNGHGGFTSLPTLHQACKLQTASLAVSIVAVIFFLLSILVELLLVRHRRKEKRFGPSPANDYSSGYGHKRGISGSTAGGAAAAGAGGGFLGGLFGGRRWGRRQHDDADPNALPVHTAPGEVRDSYGTEQTRVANSRGTDSGLAPGAAPYGGKRYGEPGYDYDLANEAVNTGGRGYAPGGGGGAGYTNGVEGGGANVVQPAHYPAGNYRYDDGVYNARV